MCQSILEGGRRCATHTRPDYQGSLTTYLEKPSDKRTNGKYHNLFSTARAFASTKKGQREIANDAVKYYENKEFDVVYTLKDALAYGEMTLRRYAEADKEVKQIIASRTQENLGDALDVVAAAIALGYPAPSFIGSKYYAVYASATSDSIREEQDEIDHEFLGDYPTRELAQEALVSWIKEKLYPTRANGSHILGVDGEVYWTTRGETSWVAGERATNEEVIYNYFSVNYGTAFLIQEKELIGQLNPETKRGQRKEASREVRDFTDLNRNRRL